MKKIIKKIILVILIFILIFVFYSKYIRKDLITKVFGKGFLVVVSESMKPTIEAQEFLIISEKKNYKSGDIVSYIDNDEIIVTHRIKDINGKTFIARGDANNIDDKEIGVDKILGKVVFHSKLLGLFIIYCLRIVVILYIVYLIVSEIIYCKKMNEVDEKDKNESEGDKNEN